MVRNIQLKHSGKYVCMVHTEVDTVSAAAELTVRGGWLMVVFIIITCNNTTANRLNTTSAVLCVNLFIISLLRKSFWFTHTHTHKQSFFFCRVCKCTSYKGFTILLPHIRANILYLSFSASKHQLASLLMVSRPCWEPHTFLSQFNLDSFDWSKT